jgi:hypothetical protein
VGSARNKGTFGMTPATTKPRAQPYSVFGLRKGGFYGTAVVSLGDTQVQQTCIATSPWAGRRAWRGEHRRQQLVAYFNAGYDFPLGRFMIGRWSRSRRRTST